MTFNFEKEYIKNKPIFYHLLDTFINSESGHLVKNTLLFINENIIKPNNLTNIKLYDLFVDMKYIMPENKIIFLDKNIINLNNKLLETRTINSLFKDYFKNNFLIINLSFDSHATSLIIFNYLQNPHIYYIILFNSGFGLNNHPYFKNKDDETLYKPYIIISCNNENKVINILLFIKFYDCISKSLKISKYFYEYLKDIFPNFIFCLEPITDNLLQQFKINSIKKYYDIIYNLFIFLKSNDDILATNLDKKIISNLETNNNIYNHNIAKYEKYKYILDRIKFQYINDDIFIFSQQSGSCAWFSKYWPLCLYFLIFKKHDYKNFINNFFDFSIQTIENIFTQQNFITELNNENSAIVLMNQLCYKFINIKILNIENKNIINLINYTIKTNNYLNNPYYSNYYKSINDYDNLKLLINKINPKNNIKHTNNNIFFFNICKYIEKDYKKIAAQFKIISYTEKYDKMIDIKCDITELFLTFMNTNKQICKKYLKEDNITNIISDNQHLKQIQLYIKNLFNHNDSQEFCDLKYINLPILCDLLFLFNQININDVITLRNEEIYLYDIIKYYLPEIETNLSMKFTKILHKLLIIIYILSNFILIKDKPISNKFIKIYSHISDEYYHFYNSKSITISNKDKMRISIFYSLINNNINTLIKNLNNFILKLFLNKPSDYYINMNEILQDNMRIVWGDLYKFSNYIILHETENILLEDIINENNFLFENPTYIYNNYLLYNNFTNSSLKFKLNINIINNNLQLRNKILSFFLNSYIINKNNNNIKNLTLSLIHIQLLLFKCHSDINDTNIKYYHKDLSYYNLFQRKIPNFDFNFLDNILYNIFIYENENNDKFINTFLQICDSLLSLETYKIYLFNKHGLNINRERKINIHITLKNLFNIKNDTLIYSYKNFICMVNYNQCIQFEINTNNKISKIYYNNNLVISNNDIKELFINIIPTNCFHLIYKKKNQYHITYFLNNKFQLTKSILYDNDGNFIHNENILNKIDFDNRIITIRISTQNNFLPIGEDIHLFKILLYNYGYNYINFIYIANTSTSGYIISSDEYNYFTSILKKNIFKELINIDNNEFDLIDIIFKPNILVEPLNQIILDIEKKYSNITYSKFRQKIEKLLEDNVKTLGNINIIITNFTEKKLAIEQQILNIHDINLFYNNITDLVNYIVYIKIINTLNDLKINHLKPNFDYTSLKIYAQLFENRKYKFEYLFEYLFEFIYGFEILDEQFIKYKEIIQKFVNIQENTYTKNRKPKQYKMYEITYAFNELLGGSTDSLATRPSIKSYDETSIKINKFMMGKGKSSVITPLLALYFSLIHSKKVYIIVPAHLKKQTEKTMYQYIYFFKLDKKIVILSDNEVKINILYQRSKDIQTQFPKSFIPDTIEDDSIMLIDEFDTILEPTTSNFNIKLKLGKSIDLEIFYSLLNNILEDAPSINKSDIFQSSVINKNIKKEINTIKNNIRNKILVENINWGIHPVNGYAIPYFNKNKPNLNSTFSSVIITIYLTLYYYIILCNCKYNLFIDKYIRFNNILQNIFFIEIIFPTENDIKSIYNNEPELNNNKIKIIESIINNIKLTEQQLNISFVDILMIPNIYKICYSGTLNINYPDIDKKFDINDDEDELINVEYAIKNNETNIISNDSFTFTPELKYDAYIDICGIFKDESNLETAHTIYKIFNRPVIFIDEEDEIKFIIDNNINLLNDKILNNPIFYYDQAHIVGIDIKQEKYPDLKGLCFINNKTIYSQLAQGLFRLRKINCGHTIDIFINDISKQFTKNLIYDMLIENENKLIANKKLLLDYQTYKAKTRIYKHDHIEKVAYYFQSQLIFPEQYIEDDNEKLIISLLSSVNILIIEDYLKQLNLYNYEIIYKLIFNIDNNDISTLFEIALENELQKIVSSEESHNEISIIFNIDYPLLKMKIIEPHLYFTSPLLISFIKTNQYEIFCFPTIFTFKISGLAFVYHDKKLILIPGSMIKIFIKKYYIFNIYLNQINHNYIKINDDLIDILNLIKQETLFKIIINKKNIPSIKDGTESLLSYNIIYILIIIIINYYMIDNHIKSLYYDITISNYINYPIEWINTHLKYNNLIQYVCDISISNDESKSPSYLIYDKISLELSNLQEEFDLYVDPDFDISNIYIYNLNFLNFRYITFLLNSHQYSSIIFNNNPKRTITRTYICLQTKSISKSKNKYIKYKNKYIILKKYLLNLKKKF